MSEDYGNGRRWEQSAGDNVSEVSETHSNMITWRLFRHPTDPRFRDPTGYYPGSPEIQETDETFEFEGESIPFSVLKEISDRRWVIDPKWDPNLDGSTIYLLWDHSREPAAQLRRERR